MSELIKSAQNRLKYKVLPSSAPHYACAVDAINFENPALFDMVHLKADELSISIFDLDTFLVELKRTDVSEFEWERLKRLFVGELKEMNLKLASDGPAIQHQLDSCLRIEFSMGQELITNFDDSNRFA